MILRLHMVVTRENRHIFLNIWTSFLLKAPCCIFIHECHISHHISLMLILDVFHNFIQILISNFKGNFRHLIVISQINYFSCNIIIISTHFVFLFLYTKESTSVCFSITPVCVLCACIKMQTACCSHLDGQCIVG